MDTLELIAEAVKVAYAAASFSLAAAFERLYDPTVDLMTLAAAAETGTPVQVKIVARKWSEEMYTRHKFRELYSIDVGVFRKVSDSTPATLDPLAKFVQELRKFFRFTKISYGSGPSAGTAAFDGAESVVPFVPELLKKQQQFTSVFTLKFDVIAA